MQRLILLLLLLGLSGVPTYGQPLSEEPADNPVEASAQRALATWAGVDPPRWESARVTSLVPLGRGRWIAFFHDEVPEVKSAIYKMYSPDGGLSWGRPQIAVKHNLYGLRDAVAFYQAPRRRDTLVLIADRRDTGTAVIAVSRDDGATWGYPTELPEAVRNDRREFRRLIHSLE